jgi:ABC-type antimicrobial peptide transport system permease subunit
MLGRLTSRAPSVRPMPGNGTVLIEALALAAIGLLPGLGLVNLMAGAMETSAPSAGLVAQIVAVVFAAAAFGSLYPAWRAANVDRLVALRYE